MDETNPQKFRQNWDQYDQTTRNNIDQLNVHTYWPAERNAARDVAKGADKRLWMSEVDLGPSGIPQDFDNIEPGLALSERITSDITNLESKAWVLWQAIEDQENMNAENENMNWGLIHVDFTPDNFETLEWHKNKKYYTMANYTKFIRPGDHVINNDNENTLASINTSRNQAVVVYTNTSDTEKNIDIDSSGFKQVDSSATATPHITSASANLQQGEAIEIEKEKLMTTVEPKSVTTFVIDGVTGVDQTESHIKADKSYHIENVNSEKVLDLNDNSVVQFSKDRDRTTQQWQLLKVTDGYTSKELYRIKNLAGGQVLTHKDGTVTLAPFQNLDAQKWMLSTSGNGIYTLINKESGTLLDVGDQSTNEGASVGVWKATSGANQQWTITETGIAKVEDVKVWTSVGTEPTLPETVHVYYSDGTEDDVSVNWESIEGDQYQSEGMIKVEGEIPNSAKKATATVYVSDIKELEVLKQKTVKGNAPNLPDTVTATLTNGEKVDIAVNWNEVDSNAYAEFGQFTVKGVIEGTNMQAIAYIQVVKGGLENVALNESDQPFPKASASFTGQWDDVNQLNDGDYSDARWTNWDPNEWREKDWVEIDFREEQLLSHVTFSFYDDEGGTRPPESLYLEYWNGDEWIKIAGSDVNVEAEDDITIDFEEITTSKVRAKLTAMADTCIAIREMEVYGIGDVPVVGDQTTLDNIWVNEQPLKNFESTNYNYEMELEQGEEIPVIQVETSDLLATYETVLPESVPGEAKIIVTAENGEDTATYTIHITAKEPEPTNPEDDSEEGDSDDSTDDSDQEKPVYSEINLSEKDNLIYKEVEAGQTYKIQGSKSKIKMPFDLPTGTKLAIYEKDIMEANHTGLQKAGDGYTFVFKYPEGAESPNKNFQLTLEYDEKVDGDKDIYYYNKESDQWKAQAATDDKPEQTLTVMVSQFSSYAVLTKTSAEENTENEENASNNNLPNTATNQFNLLFAGLCLLIIGSFAWRDRRSRIK
ncbi:Ig-like domain-containing protein [Gracilibacillus caseinilyticus]